MPTAIAISVGMLATPYPAGPGFGLDNLLTLGDGGNFLTLADGGVFKLLGN